MITIFKNDVPVRYVDCSVEYADMQCVGDETWREGKFEFPSDPIETSPLFRLGRINVDYNRAVEALVSDVPDREVDTWPKQESEARAWLLDNEAFTPLLDGMIETRGDTKEYLVGKIIEKADIYAIEVGRLLGEKQRLEKELINSQNN